MADIVYNKGAFLLTTGGIDWENDDIRAILVTSSYTADQDHNFVNQVTNEITTNGVARRALDNCTVTEDDTNNRIVFDADNETWTSVGDGSEVVARVVVYQHLGADDSANPLICCLDLATPRTLNGGDFTLQFNAAGVFYLGT